MTAGPLDLDDRRLDAAVRAAARADQGGPSDHLSPEQLADYSLGLHAPEEEDLIQEHLALCTECAEVVLGLMDTPEAGEGRETPARSEPEREWERLQARLAPPAAAPVLPPSFLTPALSWALAASLVLCAGLLVWVLRLRGEVAEARGPSAAVVLAALEPEGSAGERGGEAPQRLQRLPDGRLVLLLNLGDLRSFPRYPVELADARGRLLWRTADARRSDVGTFAVDLPAEHLEPGSYEVRLYGAGPRGQSPLAVYRFDLVEQPAVRADGR